MDRLKPRSPIDLVVEPDTFRGVNDIRTSTVFDIVGKKVVIAQTEPRLSISHGRKGLIISFLTMEKGIQHRYGFQAKIINVIEDYQMASSGIQPAILLEQISLPKPYNLRMYYRISPPLNSGFQISVSGQPGNIIDISLGGTLLGMTISQELEGQFEVGQMVKIALNIDENKFDLEAEIKRLIFPENRPIIMIACEFQKRTRLLEQILERKLLYLQRQSCT